MLTLSLKSLFNRRFVSTLTIVSIALSVCLILGVERLRSEARSGFANSAAGIDLIVASRGNPVQILLATVFGVGSTGNALSWETFEAVQEQDAVAWAVPISMGDNHRGYPVIGTLPTYFTHFRHSGGEALEFAAGRAFSNATEAVLGAELARRFTYGEGDKIVLAHGSGDVAFHLHDQAPFTVRGILSATGTAVDRMVLVSLRGFDELHSEGPENRANPQDFFLGTNPDRDQGRKPRPNNPDVHDEHDEHEEHEEQGDHNEHAMLDHGHEPRESQDHNEPEARQINAVYLGLKDRTAVLGLQRYFSEYEEEPLTAVMPNVALLELWSLTGTAEAALGLMAVAVALAGLLGLLATLSAALESRRREFSVLRSVGATPWRIFTLIVLEAAMLTIAGLILGYLALLLTMAFLDPVLSSKFGLRLTRWWPSAMEWALMLAVFVAGLVASLAPALRVYRLTLADGLSSGH
jgi:putative ABC transport system permease protein